jgi:hypothetical protein
VGGCFSKDFQAWPSENSGLMTDYTEVGGHSDLSFRFANQEPPVKAVQLMRLIPHSAAQAKHR